ncbi:glycine betaine/proline transport system permease protein [Pullulanibacillus pueri]|uniref:Glycine/betaine ABC transporter permease n=1 Tax=Pullulanibacillus pueri TaxID=1437324 RepID=A0A8J2ZZN1_9BACL|nr:proline/glycine betaine ABC transporter permease [Pullulanibacillus pueri]MBM7683848.1 glycine betaine/proline transport system permease protein [Pullulanibacillus pueri]GGH87702.1 glycine/betaine ABC transporter permease [Pullulanibacillus pueri]
MFDFPTGLTFHVGNYVSDLVDWLTVHWKTFFDGISNGLLWVFSHFNDFLIWMPWWFFVLVIFLLACQFKSVSSGILFAIFLILIGIFGYWDEMMYTLCLVISSVVISLIIGIPLGIFMAYSKRFEMIAKPILDGMQTMPTFVYLIPALFFFGLGLIPGVLSTIIYALPPVMRLTNLAIRGVPEEVVEASLSFGSSRWQLLTKVQIPQAMPTIMAGINQTTMMALAMVVVASMVGVKGLGLEVLTALGQIDVAKGFEAGISIVFLAIIIDRITLAISNTFQKK